MDQNGSLNSIINQNSLALDKGLTQKARDMARRINQRCIESQSKVDDLEHYSREVILRVTSTTSKMANLKNFKAVKQVISTQNVLKPEDMRDEDKSTGLYSTAFLESYKSAVMACGQIINSLENPAIFPSTSHYDGPTQLNGYSNGHSSKDNGTNGNINGCLPTNGNNGFKEDTASDDEIPVQKNPVVNKQNLDIGSVRRRDRASDVEDEGNKHLSQPPTLENLDNKRNSTNSHSSSDQQSDESSKHSVENPLFSPPEAMSYSNGSDSKRLSASLDTPNDNTTAEPSPLPKVVMRSAAMASVIGEIRQKNAAKTKFFDSDSDSDKEQSSGNHTKPVPSQRPPPKSVPIPDAIPAPRVVQSAQKIAPVAPKATLPTKSDYKPSSSAQPSIKPQPIFTSNNIFDSDSESDTEFVKPLPKSQIVPVSARKPAAKPVTTQISKPVETRAPKLSTPTPVVDTKAAPVKKPLGKSLFSSDSDSDDEFLKAFAKPKAAVKTAPTAVEKPVAKPLTAAVGNSLEKPVNKPDSVAPKVVEKPVNKSTIPPSVAANTTTIIPRKVDVKVETKKPVTKSLFDDSDSDSDLFTNKGKPKSLINTKKESSPPAKVVVEATLPESEPIMKPSTSEQKEPASSKKGQTSEKMAGLIANLQGSIPIFGATVNIPDRTMLVTEKQDDVAQEEETTVGTILKGRCRGPSNRRPPTRVPK